MPNLHSLPETLLYYITLHCIALHCITLHYITLHYITLISLHYITLHYITLHYIKLHYIASFENLLGKHISDSAVLYPGVMTTPKTSHTKKSSTIRNSYYIAL